MHSLIVSEDIHTVISRSDLGVDRYELYASTVCYVDISISTDPGYKYSYPYYVVAW